MTLDWELVKTMHYAFSILRYIFGWGEKSPGEGGSTGGSFISDV